MRGFIKIVVIVALSGCSYQLVHDTAYHAMDIKPGHHTEKGFRNHPYVETAASRGLLFIYAEFGAQYLCRMFQKDMLYLKRNLYDS